MMRGAGISVYTFDKIHMKANRSEERVLMNGHILIFYLNYENYRPPSRLNHPYKINIVNTVITLSLILCNNHAYFEVFSYKHLYVFTIVTR